MHTGEIFLFHRASILQGTGERHGRNGMCITRSVLGSPAAHLNSSGRVGRITGPSKANQLLSHLPELHLQPHRQYQRRVPRMRSPHLPVFPILITPTPTPTPTTHPTPPHAGSELYPAPARILNALQLTALGTRPAANVQESEHRTVPIG